MVIPLMRTGKTGSAELIDFPRRIQAYSFASAE
jgi:hypothetical protein